MLKVKQIIRMRKKDDLSDFELGIFVGSQLGWLSETADLLGLSPTQSSLGFTENAVTMSHRDVFQHCVESVP